ncbi:uncharacterized protein LOC119236506 [Talpa occidentalis]|uniref:uncharacterized protein LOC119236506 n=1 Tax=Talpa occidentalis TaxID=50954 RepID=UPI00188E9C52|nr:uncharacterized protein LOC119236506 [Talpa occidentalis]
MIFVHKEAPIWLSLIFSWLFTLHILALDTQAHHALLLLPLRGPPLPRGLSWLFPAPQATRLCPTGPPRGTRAWPPGPFLPFGHLSGICCLATDGHRAAPSPVIFHMVLTALYSLKHTAASYSRSSPYIIPRSAAPPCSSSRFPPYSPPFSPLLALYLTHPTAIIILSFPQLIPLGHKAAPPAPSLRRGEDISVQQFLLTNLVEVNGRFVWRVNLDALTQHMDKIMAFPPQQESYPGPTLFLLGGNSQFVRACHHPEIRRLFPWAQMQTVPDAGHWIHADRPQDFMAAIRGFQA